ncbi:MAG: hypothetical protein IPK07_20370 [Deltaproteobacteria bacterium]|nr:hypothetical protein [Deltaproteobacteria bacterium]
MSHTRPPRRTRLLVLAASIALLAGEGVARIAERPRLVTELRFPPGDVRTVLHRPAPGELGYERVPGAQLAEITHDSLGFRGDERPLAKPPGTFRILALGDSITYGAGIPLERTYPKVLESLLGGATTRIEVWNGGTIGYNARQEALWLERSGLAIQPDLVLVAACANDLGPRQVESTTRDGIVIREYAPPLVPLVLGAGPRARAITERSALARFAQRAGARFSHGAAAAPILDPQAEANAAAYRRIRDHAAAAGARTALVVFPMLGATDDGLEAVRRRIVEIGVALEIPTLDLADAFRALPPAELRLVATDPWHPNATGHALAAQEAARLLREEHLVPEAPSAELRVGGVGEATFRASPSVDVGAIDSAPSIDGSLDDDAWRRLTPLAAFLPLPDAPEPPARATLAWLAHDAERLYVAFRCADPDPGALRAAARSRDGDRIWDDDEVEVFLAPSREPRAGASGDAPFFQVIVSAAGAIYDREHGGRGLEWNAASLVSAVARDGDAWSAEVAIPFASLGRTAPLPGERWRANLARHVSAGPNGPEWLTWASMPRDSLLEPAHFGTIRFAAAR